MAWGTEEIRLSDERYFETLNGLWTGKRPPFIRAGVIRNTNFTELGRIDFADVAWLNVEAKQLAKRQLRQGDIIVERSGGGPKQPVGRVVFFDGSGGPFSFSNFTSTIRVRDADTFDPRFVFYSLMELYQSGRTEDIQRRTTGIRNLDFTAYRERATFPLIPLDEQRKIAAVLGLVQRAIEQQERLIALTAELKRALLHKLFTEGLRGEPQKQTEIGPVPESWQINSLGQHCVSSAFGPRFSAELYDPNGNVITLRTTDLDNDGNIDYRDAPRATIDLKRLGNHVLQDGDVVVSRSGTCGIAAVFDGHEMPVLPGAFLIRLRLKPDLLAQYLRQYINSPLGRSRIQQIAQGAIQKNISGSSLKAFRIPVPEVEEQMMIITHAQTLDRKLRIHMDKRRCLGDLFRTLLHQLMTAQIRVHDLDLAELTADADLAGAARP